MIVAEIKNVEQLKRFMQRLPQRVEQETTKEMRRIAIDLQRHVKEFKLSGQVLKNRTGNLRRAIAQRVEIAEGQSIAAIVGVQPNATKYAKIHEFGGNIQIPAVSGKLMVFMTRDGKKVFTTKHRAFEVHMPQRSFLRSSLAEKRGEFVARLNTAVTTAVKGR